jgi:hypothetical protein
MSRVEELEEEEEEEEGDQVTAVEISDKESNRDVLA